MTSSVISFNVECKEGMPVRTSDPKLTHRSTGSVERAVLTLGQGEQCHHQHDDAGDGEPDGDRDPEHDMLGFLEAAGPVTPRTILGRRPDRPPARPNWGG